MISPKPLISILLSMLSGWMLIQVLRFARNGMAPALAGLLVVLVFALAVWNAVLIRMVRARSARLPLVVWGIVCLAGSILYDRSRAEPAMLQAPRRYHSDKVQVNRKTRPADSCRTVTLMRITPGCIPFPDSFYLAV